MPGLQIIGGCANPNPRCVAQFDIRGRELMAYASRNVVFVSTVFGTLIQSFKFGIEDVKCISANSQTGRIAVVEAANVHILSLHKDNLFWAYDFRITSYDKDKPPTVAAFHPSGDSFLVGGSYLELFEIAQNVPQNLRKGTDTWVATWKSPSLINAVVDVQFNYSGQLFFTVCDTERFFKVWHFASKMFQYLPHPGPVSRCDWNSLNCILSQCNSDNVARIWTTSSTTFEKPPFYAMSTVIDGTNSSSEPGFFVVKWLIPYDPSRGIMQDTDCFRNRSSSRESEVWAVSFDEDGTIIIYAIVGLMEDQKRTPRVSTWMKIPNAVPRNLPHRLSFNDHSFLSCTFRPVPEEVIFSPSHLFFFLVDNEGTIVRCDLSVGRQRDRGAERSRVRVRSYLTGHKRPLREMARHPKLPLCASLDDEGRCVLWALNWANLSSCDTHLRSVMRLDSTTAGFNRMSWFPGDSLLFGSSLTGIHAVSIEVHMKNREIGLDDELDSPTTTSGGQGYSVPFPSRPYSFHIQGSSLLPESDKHAPFLWIRCVAPNLKDPNAAFYLFAVSASDTDPRLCLWKCSTSEVTHGMSDFAVISKCLACRRIDLSDIVGVDSGSVVGAFARLSERMIYVALATGQLCQFSFQSLIRTATTDLEADIKPSKVFSIKSTISRCSRAKNVCVTDDEESRVAFIDGSGRRVVVTQWDLTLAKWEEPYVEQILSVPDGYRVSHMSFGPFQTLMLTVAPSLVSLSGTYNKCVYSSASPPIFEPYVEVYNLSRGVWSSVSTIRDVADISPREVSSIATPTVLVTAVSGQRVQSIRVHEKALRPFFSNGCGFLCEEGVVICAFGNRLYALSKWRPEVSPIFAIPQNRHVPEFHPRVLVDLMNRGELTRVEDIFVDLRRQLEAFESRSKSSISASSESLTHTAAEVVVQNRPLSVALSTLTSGLHQSSNSPQISTPSSAAGWSIDDLDTRPDEVESAMPSKTHARGGRSLSEKDAEYLRDMLASYRIVGLTSTDQLKLLSVLDALIAIQTQPHTLDVFGVHVWLSFRMFTFLNRVLPPSQRASSLSYGDICYALHSDAQSALFDLMFPPGDKTVVRWEDYRAIGIPLWMKDPAKLREAAERLAKQQYLEFKDANDCALLYLALKKKTTLVGLFKVGKNEKFQKFFMQDFEADERARTSALKNAYALLSKQKFELAAAYFLLAGSLKDCVQVLVRNGKDPLLALFVTRLFEGSFQGPHTSSILSENFMSMFLESPSSPAALGKSSFTAVDGAGLSGAEEHDEIVDDSTNEPVKEVYSPADRVWLRYMVLVLLQRHEDAVEVFADAEHIDSYADFPEIYSFTSKLKQKFGDPSLTVGLLSRTVQYYKAFGCPSMALEYLLLLNSCIEGDESGELNASEFGPFMANAVLGLMLLHFSSNSLTEDDWNFVRCNLAVADDKLLANFLEPRLSSMFFSQMRLQDTVRLAFLVDPEDIVSAVQPLLWTSGWILSLPRVVSDSMSSDAFALSEQDALDLIAACYQSSNPSLFVTVRAAAEGFTTKERKHLRNIASEFLAAMSIAEDRVISNGASLADSVFFVPGVSATFVFTVWMAHILSSMQLSNAVSASFFATKQLASSLRFFIKSPGGKLSEWISKMIAEVDCELETAYHDYESVGKPKKYFSSINDVSEKFAINPRIVFSAFFPVLLISHLWVLAESMWRSVVSELESDHIQLSSSSQSDLSVLEHVGGARYWASLMSSAFQSLRIWDSTCSLSLCLCMYEIPLSHRVHVVDLLKSIAGTKYGKYGSSSQGLTQQSKSSSWKDRLSTIVKPGSSQKAVGNGEGFHSLSHLLKQTQDDSLREAAKKIFGPPRKVPVMEEVFVNVRLANHFEAKSALLRLASSPSEVAQDLCMHMIELLYSSDFYVSDRNPLLSDLLFNMPNLITPPRPFASKLNFSPAIEMAKFHKELVWSMCTNSEDQKHVAVSVRSCLREFDVLHSMKYRKRSPSFSSLQDDEAGSFDSVLHQFDDRASRDNDAAMANPHTSATPKSKFDIWTSRTDQVESGTVFHSSGATTPTVASSTSAEDRFSKKLGAHTNPSSRSPSVNASLSLLSMSTSFSAGLSSNVEQILNRPSFAQTLPVPVPVAQPLNETARHDDPHDVTSHSLASHPFLPFYVSGNTDGSVSLWQFGASERIRQYTRPAGPAAAPAAIISVRFSEQGNKFGACDRDGGFYLWRWGDDVDSFSPFLSIPAHASRCSDFAFVDGGSVVVTVGVSGSAKELVLWDFLYPQPVCCRQVYEFDDVDPRSVLYIPSRKIVIVGGKKGDLVAFSLESMCVVKTLVSHTGSVRSLSLEKVSGRLFASGCTDGDIRIWDVESLEPIAHLEGAHPRHTFYGIQGKTVMRSFGVMQVNVFPTHIDSCGGDGRVVRRIFL
eukprot:ANDGO_04814.mRNA.1 Regulator of V-ATPase in vacuolar membrane protein 1